MNELLITDWDTCDAQTFYKKNIETFPLAFSSDHNLWVANSYAHCRALFIHPDAWVPRPGAPVQLSRNALLLIDHLARVTNGVAHREARLAGTILYQRLKSVDPAGQLVNELSKLDLKSPFDWVKEIGKTIPLLCILEAFSYTDRDCKWILRNITSLLKVMQPHKTSEDVAEINEVVDHFFALAEDNLIIAGHIDIGRHHLPHMAEEDVRVLVMCNLIGLLIQSYDAGRGLLCNGLLRTAGLNRADLINVDMGFFEKLVTETLRIDPPVHNTRRIAVKDIQCGNRLIKKGDLILLVLAAANLDPNVFERPHHFDPHRANNDAHLSFGYGGHACIAKEFVMRLTAVSCFYIHQTFSQIQIAPQKFGYEPLKNAKLLKNLYVTLSDKRNDSSNF